MSFIFFKKAAVIFLVLFCFSFSQIFCYDNKREYLVPEQVVISTEGIFVVTEKGLLPVEGIMQDAQGLYYVALPLGYWKCRNGHPNPP